MVLEPSSYIGLRTALSNQLLPRPECDPKQKNTLIEKLSIGIIFAVKSCKDLFMEDISHYRLQTIAPYLWFALSTGAVEYTNCTSEEG